jgi:hypothetical protein
MKDGFNRWAESSAPARHGGAEKCGCEKESLRGRGVVDDIKQGISALPDGEFKTGLQNVVKFGEKAAPFAKAAKGLLKNTGVKALAREIGGPLVPPVMDKIVEYMELVGLGHMKGNGDAVRRVGGSKSFKDWCKEEMEEHQGHESEKQGGVPPAFLNKVEKMAKGGNRRAPSEKVVPVTKKALAKVDAVVTEDHPPQGPMSGKRATMKGVKEVLLKSGMMKKHVAEAMKMARGGSIVGDAVKWATDLAKKVVAAYKAIAGRKQSIHAILDAPELNEENPAGATDVPRKIKDALKYVGLGKGDSVYLEGGTGRIQDWKGHFDNGINLNGYAPNRPMLGKTHGTMKGGAGRDDALEQFSTSVPRNGYAPATDLIDLGADTGSNPVRGGRKPSAYAQFVKAYAKKHPGPDLMKRAATAWKSQKK